MEKPTERTVPEKPLRPWAASSLLRQYGLRPKKALGQNFLLNVAKAERIAAAAIEIAAQQGLNQFVEIGAGLGALTLPLARHGGRIVAYEIDPRLQPALENVVASFPNVLLRFEDVLQADLRAATEGKAFVAVGNIPFQITAPLLERLFQETLCRALVLTVQQEVAERLTAAPGSKAYGPLTVFCQYYVASIERIVRLSPRDYLPPPLVSSVALRLIKREKPPFTQPKAEQFTRIVRALFTLRRKSLLSGLAQAPGLGLSRSQAAEALREVGLYEERRAETLTLEELAALAIAIERITAV